MKTPKTIEDIYGDYRGRREGLLRALVQGKPALTVYAFWASDTQPPFAETDAFFQACDPNRDNLSLYAFPDGTWKVDTPADEVPPEIPEPVLGINFARDGMERKDWLGLCAVHSDAWLMSVAFFYAARYEDDGRAELFSMINQHPTIWEVVTGRAQAQKMYKKRKVEYRNAYEPVAAAAPLAPWVKPGREAELQKAEPKGRKLASDDINDSLLGREGELLWPDDNEWYLVQITNVDLDNWQLQVQYYNGDTEELEVDEVLRDGHLRLL